MLRLSLLSVLLSVAVVDRGFAQETDADEASAETEVAAESADDSTTVANDDDTVVPAEDVAATESGDYQAEEDEDDFVPTQDVSSDQSVRFPVDI